MLGARDDINVLGTLLYADVLDGGTTFAGSAAISGLFLAIAAPLAVMRSSLVGSLVNVLRYNLARKADLKG